MIKEYETKIWKLGNGLVVHVPSWIRKAFDVNKGDKVVVRLEKLNKDDNSRLHDAPVV